jgi:type 1 glutamine amidotransferase
MSLHRRIAAVLTAATALSTAVCCLAQSPAPAKKKIVLVAGKKSHGPVGNGQHDYGWSVLLLRALLESSNVRDLVRVEHHLDGWPKDEKAVEDADTIMVVSDGRDGNAFAEALHLENDARVALIDRLTARGCGLVTFHFSTFAPEKYGPRVLEWNGGYFQWETDGKRKWYSAIKTLKTEVKVASAAHPIGRGVAERFAFADEFYYRLRFRENDARRTPILRVPALGGTPDEHTVAWAVERKDGGRGFGTTAGHSYAGWQDADFRKLMLNAIVWSAKVEVPAGGVESKYFSHDEIRRLVGAPAGADAKPGK